MVDLSRVRYDLIVLVQAAGALEPLHVGQALAGLQWEEPTDELATRIQARLVNRKVERYGAWLHQLVPPGAPVLVYADWGEGWQEVTRGTVYVWDYQSGQEGVLSITAYDMLAQWASVDDRYYPAGTTGRAIIQDIAAAWQIPMGIVEGPDVALSKQIFRSRSIKDMVFDVLHQSRMRGAGRFVVYAERGRVHIRRPGWNQPVYHFGADSNVLQTRDNRSMEPGTFITRIKVVGQEDLEGRRPVVATLDGLTEFGVIQDLIYAQEYDTPAAAMEAARQELAERGKPIETRTVVAPDLPLLRRGHRIHVSAGTLNGFYDVVGIHHDADARRMDLEVVPSEG